MCAHQVGTGTTSPLDEEPAQALLPRTRSEFCVFLAPALAPLISCRVLQRNLRIPILSVTSHTGQDGVTDFRQRKASCKAVEKGFVEGEALSGVNVDFELTQNL